MSIKMKDMPTSERPYEKLLMYGPNKLSNAELLAIIIKNGTKEDTSIDLSHKILSLKQQGKNNLRELQDISIEEFMSIKGIGKVKAIQLKAICELAKRMSSPIDTLKICIRFPSDVANLLMDELRFEKREIVKVLILNTKNILLKTIDISYGGTSSTIVEPKDVLLEPIKMGAPKMILVHNHPSGDPKPSKSDYAVTDRIYEAAELVGITLLDHIVIGDGKYESIFAKKGLWN